MGVTLRRLGRDECQLAAGLTVAPEQRVYTGTVTEALAGMGEFRHPHGVFLDETMVGFFIVDSAFAVEFDFCDANDLGIRTFLIDSQHQGLGLGKAATVALRPFLVTAFPGVSAVWLTVNCRNPGAYRCYEQGGFSDTGALYEGGSAGPQHVMRLALS
ncbi:GNAT family N-acetyltransferase [Saccharospirillum impatiens]|uniref:GNAT family N-acetyltransferase n=1 Tax=Saccharospirillum impatiens TaxID=169438 RepID=UPI00048D0F52|nr:GNAT family N-acetyltransferase [Saccharospirillum impatiens]